MTNAQRRQIVNDAKLRGYQGSYVDLFKQAQLSTEAFVASTPQQKEDGLRPFHQAGNTETSMAFTDVPPNTPFNTVGMKVPIDIKKYDEQGHLVKSYESVPPGIQSLDTGPARGTVLETPSRMQEGNFTESADIDETLDAVTLEHYLAENRGQTPEFWRATADTLAFHESGPHQRMSPTAVQDEGGPGRGMLQFEPEALKTAQTRHASIAKETGLQPDPEIMNATSADELSKDQQYSLMYSDMIENPSLPLKDYAKGKMSIEDLWVRGHKKKEAPGDRESFEESRQAAKKELSKYGLRFGGVSYSNRRYKR
jgi:hypothetical protein